MKAGRLIDSFEFLPEFSLNWYYWKNKRHFYLGVSWLFWYVTTLNKFDWEEKQ